MYNCNSTFIEITPFKFEKKEKTRNSWQISKKISDKRNVRFPKLKLTFLKALDNSFTNIVSGNLQDFIWLLRNRFVNFAKSSGLECENTGLSVLFENKLKKICSLMTRKPLLSSFYHIILVYIKLLLASKKTKTFKKIPKQALSIIYPAISYDDALAKANLVSLECRRHDLCYKYINSLPEDHPVKRIIYARTVDIPQHYEPRSNASRRLAPARTNRLSEFVSVKYLNV